MQGEKQRIDSKIPKTGLIQSSDCQLIGNLKFKELKGEKMVQLESVKGSLLIQMESGALYSMEVMSMEQLLMHPHIQEVPQTLHRVDPESASSSLKFSKQLPFKVIRKSSAETNDQKGSIAQILVPVKNKDKVSLLNIDYTPT